MIRIFKYTVQAGDTLTKITHHFKNVTLAAVENANPHINPNLIKIGQVINIPVEDSSIPHSIPPKPTPPLPHAENIGYWDWTWHNKPASTGNTIGIAFSGWTDVDTALAQSAHVYNRLVGEKYLCLGGGGKGGRFDETTVQAVTTAIKADKFKAYQGIAYDIEVGTPGLATVFQTSFAVAKAKGYKVLVTISHSAPFGISDGATVMQTFFKDENIDFLSPQLYTTGKESANNYAISHGVQWQDYANSKAAIIPSIVHERYYHDAQTYFQQHGVTLKGYIRWGY